MNFDFNILYLNILFSRKSATSLKLVISLRNFLITLSIALSMSSLSS